METYLQSDIRSRNSEASTSNYDEPYDGYNKRSFGAGRIITVIILIAFAALGGWLVKGWFVGNELKAADETIASYERSAQEAYSYGYSDGMRAASATNEIKEIPQPGGLEANIPSDSTSESFPSVDYVFCGAFIDPATNTPFILLGNESYWLNASASTADLTVGTTYGFQVDSIGNSVVGFTPEARATGTDATQCQYN